MTGFQGVPTFSPFCWMISIVILSILNYILVSYFIYDYIPQFFCITIIIPFAKLSWTVIMCFMARCAVPLLDTSLVPSLLLFIWFVILRQGLFMDYITKPQVVFNALFVSNFRHLILAGRDSLCSFLFRVSPFLILFISRCLMFTLSLASSGILCALSEQHQQHFLFEGSRQSVIPRLRDYTC